MGKQEKRVLTLDLVSLEYYRYHSQQNTSHDKLQLFLGKTDQLRG